MNKKNKYYLPIGVSIFFLLNIFTPSCVDDSSLEKEEFRQMVDTLYQRQIKDFNRDLDSICNAQQDSIIQISMDSILKKRQEEIDRIMGNSER